MYFAALKQKMDNGGMELDIIVNPKVTEDGHSVIQVCFRFFRGMYSRPLMPFFLSSFSLKRRLGPQSSTSAMVTESTYPALASCPSNRAPTCF